MGTSGVVLLFQDGPVSGKCEIIITARWLHFPLRTSTMPITQSGYLQALALVARPGISHREQLICAVLHGDTQTSPEALAPTTYSILARLHIKCGHTSSHPLSHLETQVTQSIGFSRQAYSILGRGSGDGDSACLGTYKSTIRRERGETSQSVCTWHRA